MQAHKVDEYHNQDKTLKESLSLFIGGSLDFLDEDLSGEVTDILSTEFTETSTKKAYADGFFKLSTNMGIHTEWEAHIDRNDLMRFASYHVDAERKHKIPFMTIIITTKKPSMASYTSLSMTFTPKIINLSERDADKTLETIEARLEAGEYDSLNELEIIYLPLYGSKSGKSVRELIDTAIKLTPKIARGNKQKRNKLQDLLILLTSTFISEDERNKILEANMSILEDNPGIRTLKNMGGKQKAIEIAINMLRDGDDANKVSRITGLDLSRISELQSELKVAN